MHLFSNEPPCVLTSVAWVSAGVNAINPSIIPMSGAIRDQASSITNKADLEPLRRRSQGHITAGLQNAGAAAARSQRPGMQALGPLKRNQAGRKNNKGRLAPGDIKSTAFFLANRLDTSSLAASPLGSSASAPAKYHAPSLPATTGFYPDRRSEKKSGVVESLQRLRKEQTIVRKNNRMAAGMYGRTVDSSTSVLANNLNQLSAYVRRTTQRERKELKLTKMLYGREEGLAKLGNNQKKQLLQERWMEMLGAVVRGSFMMQVMAKQKKERKETHGAAQTMQDFYKRSAARFVQSNKHNLATFLSMAPWTLRIHIRIKLKKRSARIAREFFRAMHKTAWVIFQAKRFRSSIGVIQRGFRRWVECRQARMMSLTMLWYKLTEMAKREHKINTGEIKIFKDTHNPFPEFEKQFKKTQRKVKKLLVFDAAGKAEPIVLKRKLSQAEQAIFVFKYLRSARKAHIIANHKQYGKDLYAYMHNELGAVPVSPEDMKSMLAMKGKRVQRNVARTQEVFPPPPMFMLYSQVVNGEDNPFLAAVRKNAVPKPSIHHMPNENERERTSNASLPPIEQSTSGLDV